MLVEVRKGANSPKPPQERGLPGRSHAAEAAFTKRIRSNTSRRMKVCGGTSIEERYASVRRNGFPSAMYFDFGSARDVV